MVAEVRHVRNVSQQHVNKTVSGSKDILVVDITMTFNGASCAGGDGQLEITFSAVDHMVC